MADPTALSESFDSVGLHLHWIGMEWVALASATDRGNRGSEIRRLLQPADGLIARQRLDFDAAGYDRLAAHDPTSLAVLRTAVEHGDLEITGGTYSQPTGVGYGGESNVRQRVYGIRTAERHLGRRPLHFWEPEFRPFPQLAQLLASLGYPGATNAEPLSQWPGLDSDRVATEFAATAESVLVGKNGDALLRRSNRAEASLLHAESMLAIAGLWSTADDLAFLWELDEAWRDLLQAQHHHVLAYEGRYGHFGRLALDRSLSLSEYVAHQTADALVRHIDAPAGSWIVFNTLGWPVTDTIVDPETGTNRIVADIPALGWKTGGFGEFPAFEQAWTVSDKGACGLLADLEVTIDGMGRISQIVTKDWPEGVVAGATPLLEFSCIENGAAVTFQLESIEIDAASGDLIVRLHHPEQGGIRADIRLLPRGAGLEVSLAAGSLRRPDSGEMAGIQTRFGLRSESVRYLADSPFAVHAAPSDVSFDALSFVDLLEASGERGLLVCHDGGPRWIPEGSSVRNLLSQVDAAEPRQWPDRFHATYRILPHGPMTNGARWRAAQEMVRRPVCIVKGGEGGTTPASFSAASSEPGSVSITSFYRDALAERAAEHVPWLLRMVEFDGAAGPASVSTGSAVASAAKADLLGGAVCSLSDLDSVELRPFEIATLKLDFAPAGK